MGAPHPSLEDRSSRLAAGGRLVRRAVDHERVELQGRKLCAMLPPPARAAGPDTVLPGLR